MQQLEIKNLRVAIGENEIIRDLSLSVGLGEMHAVMGPNGSGKSTLAKVIAGHPDYKVTSGEVLMDGENLFELEADERARRGLFLACQYFERSPAGASAGRRGTGSDRLLRQALRENGFTGNRPLIYLARG